MQKKKEIRSNDIQLSKNQIQGHRNILYRY